MANAPTAATETRPLNATEKKVLDELLARASATMDAHSPAIRIGNPYLALTNLSVPRRDDKDRQTDLVMRGETVYLTDEEANKFNRHGMRDGRRVEVLRRLHGPAGNDLPVIPPRAMSGPLMGPPQGARPDPPGSSGVAMMTEPPEASAPVPGSEQTAGQTEPPQQDAIDLPPSRAAANAAVAGVDRDLVNAVKANLPGNKR